MMKYKLFAGALVFALGLLVSGCNAPSANSASGESSGPRAWFDAPLPETVFFPPSPCGPIIGHGASPNGIAAFELTINGVVTSIPSADTQSSLVTFRQECEMTQPGRYLLQLRAQDNAGNWSGYAETSEIIGGGETPTPTPTPAPAPGGACTNSMDVVLEGEPLQKSYMLPGQNFTKTWTVQNTGTCAWGEGYHFQFDNGESMGAPLDTPLGSLVSIPVLPGQQVTIALDQTAPVKEGWYVGGWNLVAPNGEKMPSVYVDIVVKGGTPTPPIQPVAGVTIERISTNLVYIGRASCGTLDVTITARATAPNGIKVVVLFYRFGASGEFQSVAMNPIGGDLYQRTLNPTSLFGGSIPFDQATLQYQVVVQQNDGDTSIRTPVMADIAVQACGAVTAACSSYTDQRTCEANSCNWVPKPGIVPVYECKSP